MIKKFQQTDLISSIVRACKAKGCSETESEQPFYDESIEKFLAGMGL